MKTESEIEFSLWFSELEGCHLRLERFYDDANSLPAEKLVAWLKAAFEAGYRAAQSNK